MQGMQGRLWGNEYRSTVVCIDSYQDRVPRGRLYNPGVPQGEEFHSLMEFLLKMEELLDGMRFPQPFMSARAFAPAPEAVTTVTPEPGAQEGKLATFRVRVIFRQNASWQGSVTWLDKGREESFRSVLELLLLMDSAIGPSEKQAKIG